MASQWDVPEATLYGCWDVKTQDFTNFTTHTLHYTTLHYTTPHHTHTLHSTHTHTHTHTHTKLHISTVALNMINQNKSTFGCRDVKTQDFTNFTTHTLHYTIHHTTHTPLYSTPHHTTPHHTTPHTHTHTHTHTQTHTHKHTHKLHISTVALNMINQNKSTFGLGPNPATV